MLILLKVIAVVMFACSIFFKKVLHSIIAILGGLLVLCSTFIMSSSTIIGTLVLLGYSSFSLAILAFNNIKFKSPKKEKIDKIKIVFAMTIFMLFCVYTFISGDNVNYFSAVFADISTKTSDKANSVWMSVSLALLLLSGILSCSKSTFKFEKHKRFEKGTVRLVDIKRRKND